MRPFIYACFLHCLLCLNSLIALSQEPVPFGPVPGRSQLKWHEQEFYLFIHFGPNTFTGREWGERKEKPAEFAPTDLDCEQWARIAKACGAQGIILTAKHHDGFCLWPSKYSTHTVRESPWQNGKGDVVRDLAQACKKYGIWMGLYLSPWDRNHPKYGTDEYNDIFIATMKELLTQYGDVFEFWWDGANGEGAGGKKQEYDFRRFEDSIFTFRPDIVVFSDIGPSIRWCGNESGFAGETNWNTLDTAGYKRGEGGPPTSMLNSGVEGGKYWIPAEVDVSIRPGWFYRASEDNKVKTPDKLMDIYRKSVGRGSNLLLNVPPDTRGRIHPVDSANLMAFAKKRQELYSQPVATYGMKLYANGNEYPQKINSTLLDNNRSTYLTGLGSTPEVEWRFQKPVKVSHLILQEYIEAGQRVRAFEVEVQENGNWKTVFKGTTIGYKRLAEWPPVTTDRLRIRITESLADPIIAQAKLYQ
jgi:alpha-L-fucosidase